MTAISDDVIDGYFKSLFGNSEPGAIISNLIMATAPIGYRPALGVMGADDLELAWYAIAPDDSVDAMEWVNKVIVAATVEQYREKRLAHFAGIALELSGIGDGIEVTRLYAAARDGRRWSGTHYLTGPRAGRIDGPTQRRGPISSAETETWMYLIRRAVTGP